MEEVLVFARFTEAVINKILDRMNVVTNHRDKFDVELDEARFAHEDFFTLFDIGVAEAEVEGFAEAHETELGCEFQSTCFALPHALKGQELEISSPQMAVVGHSVYWVFYTDGQLYEIHGFFRDTLEEMKRELKHADAV